MASSFDIEIPAVTLEDLQAFHARHFPAYEPDLCQAECSHSEETQEEYDDDGLGYYADGVKRTLTDEQIHMFRHSEIQRALRKRENRLRETLEAAKRAKQDSRSGQVQVASAVHDIDAGPYTHQRTKNQKRRKVLKKRQQEKQSGRSSQASRIQSDSLNVGRRIISYDD